MSSLAATQADGYYLPPEYYESGVKSKNKWYAKQQQQKSGGSGKAAAAPSVVRFELADPCVCTRCHARIGRGTRFNASKHATTETYFSTKIVEFRTRCRRCGEGQFIIRTDPKHRGFAYSGDLRRQERNWNAAEVGGITVEQSSDDDDDDNDKQSPVSRLEKRAWGLQKAVTERKQLEQLIELNQQTVGDDVARNAQLRQVFRQGRRLRKRLRQEAVQNGWKESVNLVETNVEDQSRAKGTVFGNGQKNQHKRWKRVRQASIFDTTITTMTTTVVPDKTASGSSSGAATIASSSVCTRPSTSDNKPQSRAVPRPKRRIVVVQGKKGLVATPCAKVKQDLEQNHHQEQPQSALQSLTEGYGSSSDDEGEGAT